MSVEVKICGLSTAETVSAALDAGASLVGFVFYAPSPRNITVEKAAELARLARGKARIVALVVDPDDTLIDTIARTLKPDLIQAHGSESPERVSALAARTGIAVIKAIKVKDRSDVDQATAYDASATLILYDAKAPETLAGALPGGNGIAFEWSLLEGPAREKPFILSGGLNPGNVAQAIRDTGAAIVDVSSGVEKTPGIKDIDLIRNFIEAAKGAR
jgi:phosphoribosylanthranilate isomerase